MDFKAQITLGQNTFKASLNRGESLSSAYRGAVRTMIEAGCSRERARMVIHFAARLFYKHETDLLQTVVLNGSGRVLS